MILFTPEPGDRAQVGNATKVWTIGEIVNRPYPVANLYDGADTRAGVPVSELLVTTPYEARSEPKERPLEVPTEQEIHA